MIVSVYGSTTIDDEDSGRDAAFDSRVDPMVLLDQARLTPDLAYPGGRLFRSQKEENGSRPRNAACWPP